METFERFCQETAEYNNASEQRYRREVIQRVEENPLFIKIKSIIENHNDGNLDHDLFEALSPGMQDQVARERSMQELMQALAAISDIVSRIGILLSECVDVKAIHHLLQSERPYVFVCMGSAHCRNIAKVLTERFDYYGVDEALVETKTIPEEFGEQLTLNHIPLNMRNYLTDENLGIVAPEQENGLREDPEIPSVPGQQKGWSWLKIGAAVSVVATVGAVVGYLWWRNRRQ